MADQQILDITAVSDQMFSDRHNLLSLWQELADNFYPERADFTSARVDGSEFARHLFESRPAQARRDLANSLGAMMRPRGKSWFRPRAEGGDQNNTDGGIAWFNAQAEIMRSTMYANKANYQRAMRQSDNDFVTFGNAVTGITPNKNRDGVMFKDFHLKDCAWSEDSEGFVCRLDRKMMMSNRKFVQEFGVEKLPSEHRQDWRKRPNDKRCVLVVTMPIDEYRPPGAVAGKKEPMPRDVAYVTCYIDKEQKTYLRHEYHFEFPYWVRRWELTTDSPYAHSPAAMLGLCDARLLQVQAQVILESGEKRVDPPVVATRDAILEGPNLYAGGVTWVDDQYDEKLGAAIRTLDLGGEITTGLNLKQDTRLLLESAWYLNKLTLPFGGTMTATEVNERIDEYVRSFAPIVEPFENDNAQMLDKVFSICARQGKFDLKTMPPELAGTEIKYEFDTPIQLANEKLKISQAQQIFALAGEAAKLNPDVLDNIDFDIIYRDAVKAIGVQPGWLKDFKVIEGGRAQRLQEQQVGKLRELAAAATEASQAVPNVKQAMDTITGAGQPAAQSPLVLGRGRNTQYAQAA